MWKPVVNLRSYFQESPTYLLWRRGLSLTCSSPSRWSWLSDEPKEATYPCPPPSSALKLQVCTIISGICGPNPDLHACRKVLRHLLPASGTPGFTPEDFHRCAQSTWGLNGHSSVCEFEMSCKGKMAKKEQWQSWKQLTQWSSCSISMDPGSGPRTHVKMPVEAALSCKPNNEGLETGKYLKLTGQPAQPHQLASGSARGPSLKQWGLWRW